MANDDKTAQILDIATDLMFSLGPKKVTLDDIAERVGVTKTALYHYFSSKKEIFEAAIRRESQRFIAALERALARTRDPESRLRNLIEARFTHLEKIRSKYSVPLDRLFELDANLMEAKFVIYQAETEMVASVLRQGKAGGVFEVDDPDSMAKVLVACLQGIEHHLLVYSADWQTMVGQFATASLNGLLPR